MRKCELVVDNTDYSFILCILYSLVEFPIPVLQHLQQKPTSQFPLL